LSAGEETGFAVVLGAERLCWRLSLSGAQGLCSFGDVRITTRFVRTSACAARGATRSDRVGPCPRANPPLPSSGAAQPPAAEHHHVRPDRPVPAAGAGGTGRHRHRQETGGLVAAPGGRVAAQDATEALPCPRRGAAAHASPDAELRAPLQLRRPTGPLNTALRSEAGSGPAHSSSPSLGTPCCELLLIDLSRDLPCPQATQTKSRPAGGLPGPWCLSRE